MRKLAVVVMLVVALAVAVLFAPALVESICGAGTTSSLATRSTALTTRSTKVKAFREPRYGEPLAFELAEAPATGYGTAVWTDQARAYARLLEDEKRLQFDPALAQAAREMARFHRRHGAIAPSDLL